MQKEIKKSKKKIIAISGLAVVILAAVCFAGYKIIQKRRQQKLAAQQAQKPTNIIDAYKNELPDLEKKVQQNADDPKAHRDLAVALYATGDAQKAKEQYLEEAKVNKNDPTLYNNLANAYRDSGDYDNAIKSYQQAIQLAPKEATSYINLANLYLYTLNKPDLGIETYKKALDANGDNQDVKVLLASAYEQQGDKANAKAYFEDVLKQNPDNVAAKAGLDRLAK